MQRKEYRYILPRRGRKHTCPNCGAKKSFRRYVDRETGVELSEDCGICDHRNRCGYHYTPKQFFQDHPEMKERKVWEPSPYVLSRPQVVYMPEMVEQTEFFDIRWAEKMSQRKSTFRTWMESLPFPAERIQEVLSEYYVGASSFDVVVRGGNYGPAAVFWMIDEQMRVHDAKLIAYSCDGHRVEGWGNSARSLCEKAKEGPQLEQTEKVLFGLHLTSRYPEKKVCIVESEKSALICACAFPEYVWVATGGCGNLNQERLRPLMNRTLVIYPDSGIYDKWQRIMHESGHKRYHVVDNLEQYPPNTDIADVILTSSCSPQGGG